MLETYRFTEHFELFVFLGMSTPFYSFMFTHMHHHVGCTTVNPRLSKNNFVYTYILHG